MVGSSYHPSIQVDNWNPLEVSSGGADFTLFTNSEMVYETIENKYAKGSLALIIDVDEAPARIQFDNFGFQPHVKNIR